MNFDQLRAFLAVAEEKSFSKAAKKLYQTQPAISQKVASLEKSLGHILIQRSKNHLHLTEHGNSLYSEAQITMEQIAKIRFKLDHLDKIRGGHLRIACSDTVGAFFLPPHLEKFNAERKEILVTAKISVTSSILQSLLEEKIDFGFYLLPESDSRIESVEVLNYEDVLVFPKTHPFSERTNISLQEVLKERLLLPGQNTKTRKRIEEAFHREGLELPEVQEAGSVSVLKKFVEIGMGVGICPAYAIEEADSLKTNSLGSSFQRTIALGWRKDRYLSQEDKAFIKEIKP